LNLKKQLTGQTGHNGTESTHSTETRTRRTWTWFDTRWILDPRNLVFQEMPFCAKQTESQYQSILHTRCCCSEQTQATFMRPKIQSSHSVKIAYNTEATRQVGYRLHVLRRLMKGNINIKRQMNKKNAMQRRRSNGVNLSRVIHVMNHQAPGLNYRHDPMVQDSHFYLTMAAYPIYVGDIYLLCSCEQHQGLLCASL
jgi:hypothetical protein